MTRVGRVCTPWGSVETSLLLEHQIGRLGSYIGYCIPPQPCTCHQRLDAAGSCMGLEEHAVC